MTDPKTGFPGTPNKGRPVPGPGRLMRVRGGPMRMVLCFVVVVIAYFSWGMFGESDEAPPESSPTLTVNPEFVGDGELAVILPEESKRRLEKELVAWFRGPERPPIDDGSAQDEVEWVEHLLKPEIWRRAQRLPRRVFDALDNVPATYEDPDRARGFLVRVWGKVYSVTERELPLTDGPRKAWVVELDDQSGAAWTLTTLDFPGEEVEAGTWVKAYGMFAKLWPWEGRSQPALHAFATRPLVISFPPVRHTEPRVEWLDMIEDMDMLDPATREIETEPFYGLLNYVQGLGQRGYEELRDDQVIDVLDLTGSQGVKPLVLQPVKHHLQAVRIRVSPVKDTFGLENVPENPGNIESVYRGYVVDDQLRMIWLVSPFSNEAFDVHSARLIVVEGFFYKRRLLTGRNGKHLWVPVIVAVTMKPVPIPERGIDPEKLLAVLLVGSVFLLAAFFYFVYSNRQERVAFRQRHKVRQERKQSRDRGSS